MFARSKPKEQEQAKSAAQKAGFHSPSEREDPRAAVAAAHADELAKAAGRATPAETFAETYRAKQCALADERTYLKAEINFLHNSLRKVPEQLGDIKQANTHVNIWLGKESR